MTEKNEPEAGNPRIMKEKLGEGLSWSDVVFQCVLDNNRDMWWNAHEISGAVFYLNRPIQKYFYIFLSLKQTWGKQNWASPHSKANLSSKL